MRRVVGAHRFRQPQHLRLVDLSRYPKCSWPCQRSTPYHEHSAADTNRTLATPHYVLTSTCHVTPHATRLCVPFSPVETSIVNSWNLPNFAKLAHMHTRSRRIVVQRLVTSPTNRLDIAVRTPGLLGLRCRQVSCAVQGGQPRVRRVSAQKCPHDLQRCHGDSGHRQQDHDAPGRPSRHSIPRGLGQEVCRRQAVGLFLGKHGRPVVLFRHSACQEIIHCRCRQHPVSGVERRVDVFHLLVGCCQRRVLARSSRPLRQLFGGILVCPLNACRVNGEACTQALGSTTAKGVLCCIDLEVEGSLTTTGGFAPDTHTHTTYTRTRAHTSHTHIPKHPCYIISDAPVPRSARACVRGPTGLHRPRKPGCCHPDLVAKLVAA